MTTLTSTEPQLATTLSGPTPEWLFRGEKGAVIRDDGFEIDDRRFLEVEDRRHSTDGDQLVPSAIVVFDIAVNLVRSQIDVLTNFCGETTNRQELREICNRAFGRTSPLLIAETLHAQAFDRRTTSESRRIASSFLAVVTEWPPSLMSKLTELVDTFHSLPRGTVIAPSTWAVLYCGRVLKAAVAASLIPTDVKALEDGGIGIAWGTSKSYGDVEITNDQDMVFSTSADRRVVNTIRVTNDNSGIATGIDRLRSLLGSGR